MQIIRSIEEFKKIRKTFSSGVGFVPTMGALHYAHETLIQKCVDENEISIVSIYVNPTQFNDSDDFKSYPIDPQEDLKVCERLDVNYVFMPTSQEMYQLDEVLIQITHEIASILEGASRPGHFNGMLRVVLKLFNIVEPKKVYFGKKDAQQLILVQKMIDSLFLDIEVIGCELIREKDGLAYSSRNTKLNSKNRQKAVLLSKVLFNIEKKVVNGVLGIEKLKEEAFLELQENFEVDYLEIYDRRLHKLSEVQPGNTMVLAAVYLDDVRLIDNIFI